MPRVFQCSSSRVQSVSTSQQSQSVLTSQSGIQSVLCSARLWPIHLASSLVHCSAFVVRLSSAAVFFCPVVIQSVPCAVHFLFSCHLMGTFYSPFRVQCSSIPYVVHSISRPSPLGCVPLFRFVRCPVSFRSCHIVSVSISVIRFTCLLSVSVSPIFPLRISLVVSVSVPVAVSSRQTSSPSRLISSLLYLLSSGSI